MIKEPPHVLVGNSFSSLIFSNIEEGEIVGAVVDFVLNPP